jgi:thiamine biosynthesis lipoprotein
MNVSPIVLKNGAAFEEGAFGKGYAIDRMIWVLRTKGVRRALINFGGQIGVFGDQPWITIADPEHRDTPAVGLLLANRSISTSSGSEKSFKSGSRVFTHLIDPRTGEALPPRGSVSVIDKSALTADILSTALYVMGPEEGLKWAQEHNVPAVFITQSGKVLTSAKIPGLQVFIKEK